MESEWREVGRAGLQAAIDSIDRETSCVLVRTRAKVARLLATRVELIRMLREEAAVTP